MQTFVVKLEKRAESVKMWHFHKNLLKLPFKNYATNMRIVVVIITFVMIACQQNQPTVDSSIDKGVIDSMMAKIDPASPQKRYSLDKMYEQNLNQILLAFLELNHPTWSIPDPTLWYPELF